MGIKPTEYEVDPDLWMKRKKSGQEPGDMQTAETLGDADLKQPLGLIAEP